MRIPSPQRDLPAGFRGGADAWDTFGGAIVVNEYFDAAAQTLTPARFDNEQAFYAATVTPGAVTLTPARFDNVNAFYAATVSPGAVTLTPDRFDNVNQFYAATVSDGNEVTDTHDGYWAKQWQRIRDREKKQYLESLEVIRDEIQELDEQIIEVQQVKVTKRIRAKPAFDASEFYAEQIRIVQALSVERKRLLDDEDETILLLM